MPRLDPSTRERRDDEVILYSGSHANETVTLFLSSAANLIEHWRIRAIFVDRDGHVVHCRVIDRRRTHPIHVKIARPDKPEFVFRAKRIKAPPLVDVPLPLVGGSCP